MQTMIVDRFGRIRSMSPPPDSGKVPLGKACYAALRGRCGPCENCPVARPGLLIDGGFVEWVEQEEGRGRERVCVRRILDPNEPRYRCVRSPVMAKAAAGSRSRFATSA